ncbi:hydroxymethylglutaryl-CoA reductase (NADPH) [Patescibacteria group bacterium]
MKFNKLKTQKQRTSWLEKKLNISLKNVSNYSINCQKTKNRNCENMIGITQIPLGVAGPLKIKSQQFKLQKYYLPLATTEGALIASVNRGCKAINTSQGVSVLIEDIGATRAPVFKVNNLSQANIVRTWINNNFKLLKKTVEANDKYLKLRKIQTSLTGKNLYIRFIYNTSEAMGMNMVTIATDKAVELIEKKLKIKCISLTGNFCIDKKPAWLNFLSGRGKRVWAEVKVSKNAVSKVLKTTPKKIVEVVQRKSIIGSIMSGSLGFNAHYANIVAAIFLATGQDLAHVVEGSMGVTTAEIEQSGDLYFSCYLPSLMVGTVGGGTHLETQQESLQILGLNNAKPRDTLKLAEVIGGAVLAGELSLTAALAAGHLSQAHQKLGRGKK